MDPSEDPEGRIAELAEKLEAALRRIEALEARVPHPGPPPVQAAPPPPPAEPVKEILIPSFVIPPPLPEPKPAPRGLEDVESDLGAKVLPWVGALVLIIGLGFLVAMGIERGLFGPWTQLWGAVLLSTALMVFGYFKRNEREDFGQLLMGTGSCGYYLAIAGGNAFHKLYSDETVVAGFLLWSFVNLVYGTVSRSKAFVSIGFLGGLAASLMPTRQHLTTLHLVLHCSVVLPSLLAAARHRWLGLITIGGVVAGTTLLPAFLYPDHWAVSLVWCGCGLAFAGAAAVCYLGDTERNGKGWYAPSALLFLYGVSALAASFEAGSALLLLAYGTIALLFAYALKSRLPASELWPGAVAVILVLAPLGLPFAAQVSAFTGLSVACAAFSLWKWPKPALDFAWITLVLANLCFLVHQEPLPWGQDIAFLTGLLLAAAFATWSTNRKAELPEEYSLLGILLALPYLARIGWIAPGVGALTVSSVISVSILGAVFAAAIVAVSRSRWLSVLWLAAGVLVLDMVLFGLQRSTLAFELAVSLPMTAGFGLAAWYISLSLGRRTAESHRQEVIYGGGIVIGALFAQIVYEVLVIGLRAVPAHEGTLVAVAAASIGPSVYLLFRKWGGLAGVALTFAFGADAVAIANERSEQASVLGFLLVVTTFAGWAIACLEDMQKPVTLLTMLADWALVSLAAQASFHDPSVPAYWVISGSWVVYAIALLLIGVVSDRSLIRIGSFVVFGLTVAKILVNDLATAIDPLVRVAILITLGLAMLAGGYWYVRRRGSDKPG